MSKEIAELREQFFKSVMAIAAYVHGRLEAQDLDMILNYVAELERELLELKKSFQTKNARFVTQDELEDFFLEAKRIAKEEAQTDINHIWVCMFKHKSRPLTVWRSFTFEPSKDLLTRISPGEEYELTYIDMTVNRIDDEELSA